MVARWEYGLLGPVEARVDGRVIELAGARQRLVLAMLLVAANRVVPASRLIDELWGEALPADPPAALRTQVSRLRRALGPAGTGLAAVGGGYRLSLQRGELDAARFEDGLAAATQATGEQALVRLDQVLALWRGLALAEFTDRLFARPEAIRLDELHLAARERRAELLLAQGRAEDAAAALQAVLAEHPERERARGLLMQALYHGGRPTDALAAFRSWRHYLAEDLGLDPSPALQGIEQDILRHALPATEAPARPASRALPLPVPVTSFVGREEDYRAITGLLGEARLLTLHGPGGVGKTRLALEVTARIGSRYRDGARLCDLAAIRRPAAVTPAIATAVGLSERAFQPLEDQLVADLAGRDLLLVLDNCEHVADAVAIIAERLLRETRSVTVLATSRERLRVDGEHRWPVRPLSADGPRSPAVRLFLDRARAADPTFVAADAGEIAALCARLDGLPLAIELAAARLPGTTIAELARNLNDRFGLLTVGRRADARHQSLRAVADWSYQQLPPAEQRLFDQLSVFRGWFDISDAGAVSASEPGGIAPLVLQLADRSLISARRDGDTARYRMLETLRGYGLERLEERGELEAAHGRHARWAAALVTEADRGMRGPAEAAWAARLGGHLDDLRAAHGWTAGHDTELGLRMTAELHWYAQWRCQPEVFRWADVSAAAAAGSRSPFYPDSLASAALGAVYRGDLGTAETAAHAALQAARSLAPVAARRALEALGDVGIFRGDLERAASVYDQAYHLSMAEGEHLDAAWDASSAAAALTYDGRLEEARHWARRCADAAAASGAPSALAIAAWTTGEIAALTDPGEAVRHLERAIELAAVADSRLVAGLAEVTMAALHARHGEPATALAYYQRVIPQWGHAGAWTPQWITLRTLIDLLARVGASRDAATLYGAATSATTGAPAYGADADLLREVEARLREQLTAAEFRDCTERGRLLDNRQVIDLALGAIARTTG
jgi:predicted ATPase/DNA-binding SARP family transcriptional activator